MLARGCATPPSPGCRVQGGGNSTKARAPPQRIEAARRIFPMIWFNEATTEAGRGALGWYHEKKDEQRDIGLGPDTIGQAMLPTHSG